MFWVFLGFKLARFNFKWTVQSSCSILVHFLNKGILPILEWSNNQKYLKSGKDILLWLRVVLKCLLSSYYSLWLFFMQIFTSIIYIIYRKKLCSAVWKYPLELPALMIKWCSFRSTRSEWVFLFVENSKLGIPLRVMWYGKSLIASSILIEEVINSEIGTFQI